MKVYPAILLGLCMAFLPISANSKGDGDELIIIHSGNNSSGLHHAPLMPLIECSYRAEDGILLFVCNVDDVIASIRVTDESSGLTVVKNCDIDSPAEIKVQPGRLYVFYITLPSGQAYYGEILT